MNNDFISKRTQILEQMAALENMESGSLKAEYRDSPSGERCGPYFKHQVWQDGANVSRRVTAEEAPALEAAIGNRQKFETLAGEFIEVTVAGTRQSQAGALKKKSGACVLAQQAEMAQLNRQLFGTGGQRDGGAAVGGLGSNRHFQTRRRVDGLAFATGR